MTQRDSDVRGLLCSQVGYDVADPVRIIIRGTADMAAVAPPAAVLYDENGQSLQSVPLLHWGHRWKSQWWIADFGRQDVGRYAVAVEGVGAWRFERHCIEVGHDLLFEKTWRACSYDQAERRARLAMHKVGWQDCGAAWQEANSHAAYVTGLCELLQFAAHRIDDGSRTRIERQIHNGLAYLAVLQDLASEQPCGDGAVAHQKGRFQEATIASDAMKCAMAWSLAARVIGSADVALQHQYLERAKRAWRWVESVAPPSPRNFSRINHGAPDDFQPPCEWTTRDLLAKLLLATELLESGISHDADRHIADRASALASEILSRQVPASASVGGLHGHFHTFASTSELTEKGWVHHIDQGIVGIDAGGHFPPDVMPLIRLARRFPTHPDACAWRDGVRRYTFGWFIPACLTSNPFGLLPLGQFARGELFHFAGLWHGMNAAYAHAAQLAIELHQHFPDDRLRQIATSNLQWICGLNAGLTRESLAASHMYSTPVPEDLAVSVSMICGIGHRCAGSWLNVTGSICNGFSSGDQFQFDVAPLTDNDRPSAFTDEDWITHAGAWLGAIARLASYPAADAEKW